VAKNGVLFLNSILTVQSNKPLSHAKKGWESLTEQALRTLIQRKEEANPDHGLVFMAWGIPAKKICEGLKIDQVSLSNLYIAFVVAHSLMNQKAKHLLLQ
jgi:uracil-DNA glycosylase